MIFVPPAIDWMEESSVTLLSSVEYVVSKDYCTLSHIVIDCSLLPVHISRKYPAGKFDDEIESARWKSICGKLNSHIRYRRASIKKQ